MKKVTKIMFVCHGNICRSPMAEFVFKDIVNKAGVSDRFIIESSATSYEAIGGSVHRETAKILNEKGIDCSKKHAVKLQCSDYENYDYFIGMDDYNVENMLKIFGADTQSKVCKILDFVGGGNVADPWYYGNFDKTYQDILRGCTELFDRWKNGRI